MKLPSQHKIHFVSIILLLILNIFGYRLVKNYSQTVADDRLELATLDIKSSIEAKMNSYSGALLGAAGLFASSQEVTNQEWSQYIKSLDISKNFRGIQAFGYTKIVKPEDLGAYNQSLINRKLFNTKVFPELPTSPLVPIHYVAPETEGSLKGIGFNMFSDPKRRVAMEYARDNNSIALTNKIQLVADKDDQKPGTGLVMFYPVYKNGSDVSTVEARRANILGFVSIGMKMDQLMEHLNLNAAPALNFQIFDNSSEGSFVDDSLMYNSGDDKVLSPNFIPRYSSKSTIIFPNTNWYIRFTALPDQQLGKFFIYIPYLVALLNLLLSVMFFMFIKKILTMYVFASRQSSILSQKLIYEDAIVDDSENGIIVTNELGKITVFNKKAEQVLGYTEDSVVNKLDFVSLLSKKELKDRIESLTKRTGIEVNMDFDAVVTDCLLDGKEECRWELISKAGQPRRTSIIVTPVYDSKNVLIGYKFTF